MGRISRLYCSAPRVSAEATPWLPQSASVTIKIRNDFSATLYHVAVAQRIQAGSFGASSGYLTIETLTGFVCPGLIQYACPKFVEAGGFVRLIQPRNKPWPL